MEGVAHVVPVHVVFLPVNGEDAVFHTVGDASHRQTEIAVGALIVRNAVVAHDHINGAAEAVRHPDGINHCAEVAQNDLHLVVVGQGVKMGLVSVLGNTKGSFFHGGVPFCTQFV